MKNISIGLIVVVSGLLYLYDITGGNNSLIKTAGAAGQTYSSNGGRIYYTGISERTGRIPIQAGPMWLRMHGGGCASCHGIKGTGGVPVMMGTAIPPDIRYETLTVEEHRHGSKKEKHRRYTDELIKRAITNGLNPAGKPFDLTMPRWIMTDKDLEDIIEYLKTLR